MRPSNRQLFGWIITIASVVFIVSTMPVIVAIAGLVVGWWLIKKG